MSKSRTQQTRGKVYEDFGEKIKQLRIERNLTQEELSKLIGLSRTNIGQYETGVRKVPLNIIKQFSSFFGVSVDELLDINIGSDDSDNKNSVSDNKNHITKYEVATEMGFTKEEIKLLESGTKQIPKYFFEKFANYFDVSIGDLTTVELATRGKSALVTTDASLSERYSIWFNEMGDIAFTNEEIEQLIDYAKYIISKRNR